jgi:hypothetical protein
MFIKIMTAHDEQEIMLNTDHIVLVTYYPESNMSKIDTVLSGYPVWVDGKFSDTFDALSRSGSIDASRHAI